MLAKGPPWTKAGLFFEGLHQVRHEGVLEQHRHRPVGVDLVGPHRLAIARVADDDVAEAALQVLRIAGQTEDRHDLGGDGDVEAGLAREAVADAAHRGDDAAQAAVVHVDGTPPGDAAHVEVEPVAPVDVVVDHRRQQVVGGADGVHVAGEVEVDVLHGHDLGIAAAGGTALDAEARAEAGLAQADHGLLAKPVEPVAEADRGRRLAFAGRGRGDGRHQHQPGVGTVVQGPGVGERDFGLVVAEGDDVLGGDAEAFGGDRLDGLDVGPAGDFDITIHDRCTISRLSSIQASLDRPVGTGPRATIFVAPASHPVCAPTVNVRRPHHRFKAIICKHRCASALAGRDQRSARNPLDLADRADPPVLDARRRCGQHCRSPSLAQVTFEQGVAVMLERIEHWREAPVWTPAAIEDMARAWFRSLG